MAVTNAMRQSWRRIWTLVIGTIIAVAALGTLALWAFQEQLIYPAPRYQPRELERVPAGVAILRDPAHSASIVGFYRAPSDGTSLSKLWLAFGGNGDLALRWDPLLVDSARNGTGILMVEYPGYGSRLGSPSPETLRAGNAVTLGALAQHLGLDIASLEARSAVLGYSLGSAVALDYAVSHRVRQIVLVAPFTSMLDMARRTVGSPLCYLLRHRYDNVAALQALRNQAPPPIIILHGERDDLIPSAMGQSLAKVVPESRFELVPGADHGDVIDIAAERLRSLLSE